MDPLEALEKDAGVAGGQPQVDPLAALEADAGVSATASPKKPWPFGIDLSQQKPATSIPGAAATATEGLLSGALNVPGSAVRGAIESYGKPFGEQWDRLKAGAKTAGQGLLNTAKGFGAYMFPRVPDPNMSPEGFKMLTGPLQTAQGVFEGLGISEAGDVAAKANAAMAPPQAETTNWLVNLLSDVPGQILTPATSMFVTDPTLAYGIGKAGIKAGKSAANAVGEVTKGFRAPEVDVDAVMKALQEVPDTGQAELIRTMITGERGTNPEIPSTWPGGIKPEGTTQATDWELKHAFEDAEAKPFKPKPDVKIDERPMGEQLQERLNLDTEGIQAKAAQQLDDDIKAQQAVSKNGKPKLAELSAEATEAQRQDLLDQLAKESKTLQDTMGLKNEPELGQFDRFVNVYSAAPMRRATEMLNRIMEEIAKAIPEYMFARDAAVNILKKPNKVGFFVRDYQAEENVAKALDGKLKFEELLPKEQQAFTISREVLDKVAKLEGRDITGETLADYWMHTLGKDHPLVRDLAKKGYLYDPATGEMAVPSKASFEKHRKPGEQNWSYNLGDVLGMRLSLGVRKALLDPVVYDIAQEAEKMQGSSKAYLKALLDRVQGRPGESEILQDKFLNGITSGLEQTVRGGQKALQVIPGIDAKAVGALADWLKSKGVPGQARKAQQLISRAYYRYMLGGALDTAAKNLLQGLNTVGSTAVGNELKGAGGYGKLLFSSEARAAFQKANINPDMALLYERSMNKGAFKAASEAIDKGLFKPMELTEAFNRGLAYYAGRAEAITKFAKAGIKNPAEWMIDRYAKHFVDLTQFKYGSANINPYINNPLGKLYYQFATYPAGQLNLMRQLWKSKQDWLQVGKVRVPSKLIKLIAIQGMAGIGFKEALGSDIWDTLGWGNRLAGRSLPTSVPGIGVAADIAGRLPIPSASNLLTGDKTLTSPATQLMTDPKDMLLPLLLGAAHVPGRFLKKLGTARDELTTHQAVNSKGKASYPVTEQDTLLKLLGLRPRVQQDYVQNVIEHSR